MRRVHVERISIPDAEANIGEANQPHESFSLSQNANRQRPRKLISYPKPGTRNPVATLRVADLADPKNFRIRTIKPPALLINE